MDKNRFSEFDRQLKERLADTVEEILKKSRTGFIGVNKSKVRAIGFVTTDDFYGFYVTWSCKKCNIDDYYDWKDALYPPFLYQPLVDIVDSTKDIDLLRKSDEKWEFATALMNVLSENIHALPKELFEKYGCSRDDILFFATMSDGDYMQEMLEFSLQNFNKKETL